MNGKPDHNVVYGDINKDGVLDRIPPYSFAVNVLNVTDSPESPYLAWELEVNDGTLRYNFKPIGRRNIQVVAFLSFLLLPLFGGAAAVLAFYRNYYRVSQNTPSYYVFLTRLFRLQITLVGVFAPSSHKDAVVTSFIALLKTRFSSTEQASKPLLCDKKAQRTILIATLEYTIPQCKVLSRTVVSILC